MDLNEHMLQGFIMTQYQAFMWITCALCYLRYHFIIIRLYICQFGTECPIKKLLINSVLSIHAGREPFLLQTLISDRIASEHEFVPDTRVAGAISDMTANTSVKNATCLVSVKEACHF